MNKKAFFTGGLVSGVILILFGLAGAFLFLESKEALIFSAVDFEREGYMGFVQHALARLLVGYGVFTIFALVTKGFMGLKAVVGASIVAWVLLYFPAILLFYDMELVDPLGAVKLAGWGELEIFAAMLGGKLVAERF